MVWETDKIENHNSNILKRLLGGWWWCSFRLSGSSTLVWIFYHVDVSQEDILRCLLGFWSWILFLLYSSSAMLTILKSLNLLSRASGHSHDDGQVECCLCGSGSQGVNSTEARGSAIATVLPVARSVFFHSPKLSPLVFRRSSLLTASPSQHYSIEYWIVFLK